MGGSVGSGFAHDGGEALLETLILENDKRVLVRRVEKLLSTNIVVAQPDAQMNIEIPVSATRKGVAQPVYDNYRLGLVSACADVVIVKDGKVPLIRRAQPPFGDTWWIMGGAIFNFRPIHQFLLWKIYRECGLEKCTIDEFITKYNLTDDQYSCDGVHFVGYLGVARTAADDTTDPSKVCDTLNVCGMAVLTTTKTLYHDKDHSAIRWVGREDLRDDPNLCGHWYPQWAAQKALDIYWDACYGT